MAITTSNSMRVKAPGLERVGFMEGLLESKLSLM